MSEAGWRDRIAATNSALLAALFFLLPTQIAPAYIVTAVMLLLWLAEGRFHAKWLALRDNPVFWVFFAYFAWVVVALAWTEDTAAGRGMVSRYLFFLLAAVYFTVARREHARRYLIAFALGVATCELLAAYNWLHINHFPQWPDSVRADKDSTETAPFVDRILFAPMVAFAGYIGAWQALTQRGTARVGWALSAVAAVVSLSISGSRTGMVALSLLLALLTWQMLPQRRLWAALGAVAVLCGTATTLYALGDPLTKERIVRAFSETERLDTGVNQSLPHRYTMAVNTLTIVAEHPWLGVGSGDFISEYTAVNERRSPAWLVPRNPHNQMLFALVTTGVLGGALLIAVWLAPPWLHRHCHDEWRPLRVGLAFFFVLICLAESYLWRTNTGLMFVVFSALLYGPGDRASSDPPLRT